jgi:hypothetical protein
MDSKTKAKLIQFLENGQVDLALSFLKEIKVTAGARTPAQNRAIHKWLTLVAEELDRRGFTIQNVVAKIRRAEIRPTMENLKEVMWRPYQIAALKKESTTQLTKQEVDKVYEGLNKFLAVEFNGLHIPFPCDTEKQKQNLGGYKTKAGQGTEGVDYPEYTGPSKL